MRGSIDFHGDDTHGETSETDAGAVDEAIRLKAGGLSNFDIICAPGIHESTVYCWIGDPKYRLRNALSEGFN